MKLSKCMESKWNTSAHWWAMNLNCNDLHFVVTWLSTAHDSKYHSTLLAKYRTSQWDLSAEGRGLLHTSCAPHSCNMLQSFWTSMQLNYTPFKQEGDSVIVTGISLEIANFQLKMPGSRTLGKDLCTEIISPHLNQSSIVPWHLSMYQCIQLLYLRFWFCRGIWEALS